MLKRLGKALPAPTMRGWPPNNAVVVSLYISVLLAPLGFEGTPWWLTSVYGPSNVADKTAFLDELRLLRSLTGASLVCGDFNLIYQDHDKSRGVLHRGWMRCFCSILDFLQLAELYLFGRLYTWSNERSQPTLERLDRVFVSVEWMGAFRNHYLCCLPTDCSDHAPLSLKLYFESWYKPRFRFESFWPAVYGWVS